MVVAMVVALLGCSDEPGPRLWFVGDSLVAGWDAKRLFPMRDVVNVGVPGYKIEDCIAEEFDCGGSDAVVLVGTNDLGPMFGYADKPLTDEMVDGFVDEYMELAHGLNAGRLYVVSLLPRNSRWNIVHINDYIQVLNAALRKRVEAEIEGAVFVDAYPLMEVDGGLNPDYTKDGLHLNDAGYQVLTRKVKRCIYGKD